SKSEARDKCRYWCVYMHNVVVRLLDNAANLSRGNKEVAWIERVSGPRYIPYPIERPYTTLALGQAPRHAIYTPSELAKTLNVWEQKGLNRCRNSADVQEPFHAGCACSLSS